MSYEWIEPILKGLPVFGQGLQTTLILFFEAGTIGFILGCIVALGKTRYIPKVYPLAWFYVELFRNIPLLVILFFFYYALQFTAYIAGLLALVAWASAFTAEVVRAGIDSLEIEQIHAARLLGFSRPQLIFNLVLPQALVRVLPVLANQFMNLAKNTSIVYFVGVLDVTYAFELVSAEYFLFFQFFFIALGIYVTLCLIIINIFRFLEHLTRYKQTLSNVGDPIIEDAMLAT
jgi:His/Glu/Gln/Arg/opine family amino acid ABC transporter permease subunit